MGQAGGMEPISARIPGDLYLWLAQLRVDGATTNSDKLRVLLGQLKRQHDGALDYAAAHAWARELTGQLRESLVVLEGQGEAHSEVLGAILDFTTAALASIISQAPKDAREAAGLEDALVRRSFALCEALLRQAITASAAAHDPDVIRRHVAGTVEIAASLPLKKGA